MLKALQKKTVFSSLCNTDYIGEVKKGNSLKIATIENPTIKEYTKGTDIDYDEIGGNEQTLSINQQKYFAFKCEDIDKVQSSIALIESATEGAGYGLADDFDEYLAGIIADNGTSKDLHGTTYYRAVAEVSKLLDDAKAPDAGRWLVMPSDFATELLLETAEKISHNNDIVTSGYIGSLFGISLYKSPNIEKAIYGHTSAVTMASQIEETEKIRLEKSFADGVRGLHVYGAKVTRPTLCGEITMTVDDDDNEP